MLVTGLVVLTANLTPHPVVLALTATELVALGILIAVVRTILLHRTLDAQNLWREAALRLEQVAPSLDPVVAAAVTLRNGTTIPADLARPYPAHAPPFTDEAEREGAAIGPERT